MIDIHIRSNKAGDILIDVRNDKGVITDIIQHQNTRLAAIEIVHRLIDNKHSVRKVRK